MKLSRIFRKAAVTGLIAISAGAAFDTAVRQTLQAKDKLAPADIELAASVFGDGIDYSKVRIVSGRFSVLQNPLAIVTLGNTIYWPVENMDTDHVRKFFIHEMTHVYQNQHNMKGTGVLGAIRLWLHSDSYAEGYEYKVTPEKTFADYNLEQQASIVTDYFAQMTEKKISAKDIEELTRNPLVANLFDQSITGEAALVSYNEKRTVLAELAKDGLGVEKKKHARTKPASFKF